MTVESALQFDEPSHTYTVAGARVPSVTDIIRPLADFSGIAPDVLARKAALGTDVHLACELDDNGELDEESTDPDVMGYVAGWRAFRRDTGFTVLMNEQRLFHPILRFAGTLDRLGDTREGDRMLIDLKTAVTMGPSFGVQLAGYALLIALSRLGPGIPIARKGLQLKPDGKYKLVPYNNPNDAACFRALLTLHQWKAQNQ